MTVGSILLAVALFVIVGLYVFRPILTPSRRTLSISQRDALLAEKDALLAQIKSLDHDYETGKVPMDEYEAERLQLKLAAADVLRQADTLPAAVTSDIDAQIEAAIRAIREQGNAAMCKHCQASVTASDKFCRECGEAL